MFPFQRLHDLFIYIYQQHVVLPLKLSQQFNVSIRTIRSDITIINKTIAVYGGQIVLVRNHGYSIAISDTTKFQEFTKELFALSDQGFHLETPENRILYISYLLLTNNNYVKHEDMEQSVFVSFNTLQNYIKTLSRKLEKYQLEVINRTDYGVKVIGDEKLKRKYLTDVLQERDTEDYISQFSHEEYFLFKEYQLDILKREIHHIFVMHHISITDINIKNLVIHIVIMVMRIKNDNYIHYSKATEINPHYELIINDIIIFLEDTYQIYLSEGEKQYLYIHIVSNTPYDILGIDDHTINTYITNLLDCIFQDYSFDLRHDSLLIDDLVKHMKSILNTKYINPDKKNPLLNTIKSNFPLPFEITLTSLNKTFVKDTYDLDEGDVGYISLHIGAAIERHFNGKFKAKNVILVCDGSHATARILEARIENYFSNKINIIAIRSCAQIEALVKEDFTNIDFIIATTSIHVDSCPFVVVDFSLKNHNIEAISKMITTIQYQEKENNLHFFDPNLFILNKVYTSKTDLLMELTQLLLDNKTIETNFLDSVLEREALAKTNINEIFAFPHPMKSYAKETKVAVALLNQPLQWNDDETVQIVFLLASKVDEQQSHMESFYNTVVEIVNNNQLQKKILKATSYHEFLNALPHIIM